MRIHPKLVRWPQKRSATQENRDMAEEVRLEQVAARLRSRQEVSRPTVAIAPGRASEARDITPAAGKQAVENDVPVSDADSDQAMAERRLSIAARLVQLGFITADRAMPGNPAVEVLSELLPPDAKLGLCLTCHGFSSSVRYPFAETVGIFPAIGSFRMNPALAHLSFRWRDSLADGASPRARGVHAGRAELDRIARTQRPPGRRHAVLGSVSRHSRRDRAPPPQRRRRGVDRRWSNTVRSVSRRRPPTGYRRTSTRRHNRSNRLRCPGQTPCPTSGSGRSAFGLIEQQQRPPLPTRLPLRRPGSHVQTTPA
jgi:hypothetical protein